MSTSESSPVRLIAVADLGDSNVTVVEHTPHGALAVGVSAGKPFAVSNRCRHLFASLGKGSVTGDGRSIVSVGFDASGQGNHRRARSEDLSGRAARRRDLAHRLS